VLRVTAADSGDPMARVQRRSPVTRHCCPHPTTFWAPPQRRRARRQQHRPQRQRSTAPADRAPLPIPPRRSTSPRRQSWVEWQAWRNYLSRRQGRLCRNGLDLPLRQTQALHSSQNKRSRRTSSRPIAQYGSPLVAERMSPYNQSSRDRGRTQSSSELKKHPATDVATILTDLLSERATLLMCVGSVRR
jgi:hypothetical protein